MQLRLVFSSPVSVACSLQHPCWTLSPEPSGFNLGLLSGSFGFCLGLGVREGSRSFYTARHQSFGLRAQGLPLSGLKAVLRIQEFGFGI